jgi:isopenicillin N synthase-like dioxygenase
MAKVRVVDYQSSNAPKEFTESLIETGFGVLQNHPIEQDLVESIYKDWLIFFESPDKHLFAFDKDKQDGYFSKEISETAKGYSVKDIKEYYHVYPNGRIPQHLSEKIMRYYRHACTLAETLLGWIEQHTPDNIKQSFSEPLSHMVRNSQQTLLRILRYPPLTGQEDPSALRAAAHGDINFITILPASNEPGLQVMDKDGTWHDVPCDFGTIAINVGDMLQELTQNYYPSTLHRVVNPTLNSPEAKRSRISLPLFLHPRPEVVLSNKHTAKTYLDERLIELGVKK